MANLNKTPLIPGLDRIPIICNTPVSYGGNLKDDDKKNYALVNRPNENDFLVAQYCGFNVMMYPGSDIGPGQWLFYMEEALKICQRLGLKLISNSPILNFNRKLKLDDTMKYKLEWPASFVKAFHKKSALVGWQLKDEPLCLNWHDEYTVTDYNNRTEEVFRPTPDMEDLRDNHKKVMQAIEEVNNPENENQESNDKTTLSGGSFLKESSQEVNKLVFMNLAYSFDKQWIGDSPSYSAYLDEYISTFHPSVLSYDYYPIDCTIDSAGNVLNINVNTDVFYGALEVFSQKSKQYDIPFWAHCLCLKHRTSGRVYPYPTVGMMRFEAFSALAYGAQGIVYWNYRIHGYDTGKVSTIHPGTLTSNSMSKESGSGTQSTQDEIYPQEAPIDINGNQTPIWDMVRTVNAEIIKFGGIFYNCNVTNHFLTNGDSNTFEGYGCVNRVVAYGAGVLVSHIENEYVNDQGRTVKRRFVVVVSSDPLNSQDIDLYYALNSKGNLLYDYKPTYPPQTTLGPEFREVGQSKFDHLTLDPGGYAIREYFK